MSFRHVVMFKWAADIADGHVDRVRDGLNVLLAQIGQIRSYVHGSDVGVSDGNYDYVVVADFDNVDDFRSYRDHPQHVQLVDDLIKGHISDRASVQYQTGPS